MSFNDLITGWFNGNKQDVVREVDENYTWYKFASMIEESDTISEHDKVSILCSMLRIYNR